ncbi:NAD(P)H-quinone oxidoreductase [Corynebacterium atypicum]|uniref:NAD(P)H-quinone oxidoreductase n=1 Tax=Corynebacterium atypicum TaxID=191610 RepID=A0ABN4DAT2_9CORY|nr:NAD(P)H-quinone oxidoreductase [Corynebacterium atypicum]AIG63429.1 NAD(P)H-quinone oxidoreductase [Corynebacterium atypicum]
MKAIVQTDPKDPASLQLAEVPTPTPAEGELLVKVHTAGVNRGDILQTRGHYPPPPGASQILGMECAGTIVENRAGRGPAVGSPVGCLLAGGGYAEYVAVPAGQTAPLPAGLTVDELGSLMEVACTVWSNLGMVARLGEQNPREQNAGDHGAAPKRVLIHGGAGGVGSFAIQLCAALGLDVAVTAGSPDKLDYCRKLGATELINYHEQDFSEGLKGSVNVILDIIGAKYLKGNLRALAPDGQLIIIGMQGGTKAEINLGSLLPRRLSIHGTTLRARSVADKSRIVASTVANVWPLVEAGAIRHHVHQVFPLADAALAHRTLDSGKVTGKLALRVAS